MFKHFCKEHEYAGDVPCKECHERDKVRKFGERYGSFDPPDGKISEPPEWFKKLFAEAYEKAVEQSNKGAGKLARKTRKKNKKRRK